MNKNSLFATRAGIASAVLFASVVLGPWVPQVISQDAKPASNVSPQLQEVLKLSQAHMNDDLIVAFIKNSGTSYTLSASDILYLKDQGVSQTVIATLLQTKSSATPPPANTAPAAPPTTLPQGGDEPPPLQPANPSGASAAVGTAPPAPPPPAVAPPGPASPPPGPDTEATLQVSQQVFQQQLAPYGEWIQTPAGLVWHPAVPMDWRPYYDGGHWVYTDTGCFWQSDYPWGDVVFHYGRWYYDPVHGWLWVPGYDYAPAWVCWRHANGYFGWAPLPPAARFQVGVGLLWNGRVAVDVDFGLTPGFFTFVACDHFWEHDYRRFVPRERMEIIYRRTAIMNGYRVDGHGRFVNEGFGRERLERFTGRRVEVVESRELRLREERAHLTQRRQDVREVRAGTRVEATRRMPSTDERRVTREGQAAGDSGRTGAATPNPAPDRKGTPTQQHQPPTKDANKKGQAN